MARATMTSGDMHSTQAAVDRADAPCACDAPSGKFWNRGFIGLMLTQFFGAMNDNVLKGVLSFAVAAGGIWTGRLGDGGQAYVGLLLSVPFILFSGYAGQLADRTSKRTMTVWVRLVEIVIAMMAFAGLWMHNLEISLLAMLMLGTHSAFFGPAKYGMIPELVADEQLSQANGTINMLTNIAVIAGTLASGVIYVHFHPKVPQVMPLPWLPGVVMLVIAVCGFVSCALLPKLRAMDPNLKFNWNPFSLYWQALKEMAESHLLLVALAWSLFYLIAAMALLILPDYPMLLNITEEKAAILMGILGLAIGVGCVLAGLISGKHIKPKLIPVGAVGMTVMFFLLGMMPLQFGIVAGMLFGAGVFAGFYIVPLQALLQHLSPDDERGRFLGTANAMSFVAITVGSLIFKGVKEAFHLPSNQVFLLCGALAIVGSGTILWKMRRLRID